MRAGISSAVLALGLMGSAAALADRVAGIAGIPSKKALAPVGAASAVTLKVGTVSATQADGARIEIDGQWLLVKRGRTQLFRNGLPVDAGVLAKGQKVQFSLASATPGEMALGVVHVP